MGKGKKILIAIIIIGAIVFAGYKYFYNFVDLSTPQSTAKAFTTAILKQNYETAGKIYPFEDSSPSNEASYLLGPLAGAVTAPGSLDDLMYAVNGLGKNDVTLTDDGKFYYIVANDLQDYDNRMLGFYREDNKVSVIRLSLDRTASEYYIDSAKLVYMDSSKFYGESGTN